MSNGADDNTGQTPDAAPDNPYAPPAGGTLPPPPAYPPPPDPEPVPGGTRTSLPKVMGVLSIVFGSLMLMGGLFGSCTALLGQKTEMMESMATIYTVTGVQNLVMALMSALLLAIGIGQLRYRQWARIWSVRWALAALVAVLAIVVLSFAVIGPLYQEMMTSISKHSAEGGPPMNFGSGFGAMMGGTFGVISIIFLSPYPILMLIFFSRPHVKLAMSE
jgi:hypothetical protein